MYVAPDSDVVFGDIFDAGSLFYDAHLQHDAANAGVYVLEKDFKHRFAEGISKALNRPVDVPEPGISLYSPSIPLGHEENTLIAHGLPMKAILLSEDCDIEDAFGRGGEPDGRLLFATVTDRAEEEINEVTRLEPFDRFALPAEDAWQGGIAELRRLFMVDVRAVSSDPAARLLRLDDAMSLQLAVTWSAYTGRRGPLAAAKHAEKLARLMSQAPTEAGIKIAEAVAEVAGACWTFEADGLAGAARAFDEQQPSEEAIDRLVQSLRELAKNADVAANQLEQR